MEKFLQTCFLAYLCLIGSQISAESKVAESPGADFLHKVSGPNRGGETLSDTFGYQKDGMETSTPATTKHPAPQLSLELSGDEAPSIRHPTPLPSPVYGLRSPIDETAASLSGAPCLAGRQARSDVSGHPAPSIRHPTPLPSSVSGLPSQHPSAQVGEVLIYGEIINPDSLGVLTLHVSTGFLPNDQALVDTTFEVPLAHGTFFDGVLDPRVQKFQVQIPITADDTRFSLKIGQRTLLKDFLAFPGDSVKVGIDLQEFQVVFAGPQASWYEAQYAAQREIATVKFDEGRVLIQRDREAFLDREDYREQLQRQQSVFGSRIVIYEFGKDAKKHEYTPLMDTSYASVPGRTAIQQFRERIPADRFRLLESQVIGAHFASHLSMFRKYHYSIPLASGDSVSAHQVLGLMKEILAKIEDDLYHVLEHGLTPGSIDLAREWIVTYNVVRAEPLEALIAEKYQSPVRERLLLSVLLKKLDTAELTPGDWITFGRYLKGTSVEKEFENLSAVFEPGTPLPPVTLYGMDGRKVSLEDYQGKPTLLYFYFTGCANSANYFRNFLRPFYQEMGEELGLQVISISVDRDAGLWQSQLSEYSDTALINLNLPMDEGDEWLARYRITAFPRAILLDSKGAALAYSLGGQDYTAYKSRILFLLQADQPIVKDSIR